MVVMVLEEELVEVLDNPLLVMAVVEAVLVLVVGLAVEVEAVVPLLFFVMVQIKLSSLAAVVEEVVVPTTLELLLVVDGVLDLPVEILQTMNLIMFLLVAMVVTALMTAVAVEEVVEAIDLKEVVVAQDVTELLQVEVEKVVALDIVQI